MTFEIERRHSIHAAKALSVADHNLQRRAEKRGYRLRRHDGGYAIVHTDHHVSPSGLSLDQAALWLDRLPPAADCPDCNSP